MWRVLKGELRKMYDNKVKSNIENLFCEVKEKVQEIIMNADDTSSI